MAYEAITYELLLRRMLETALASNSKLDTREGSILWLGQAPAAVELQNLYIALDTVFNETFADTASRDYLILRASERGLSPYPATPAVLQLSITPTSLTLPLNTRFSIGELNYYTSKNLGAGDYEITCETAGEGGNNYAGTVIPIAFIAGLETCTVTALLVPGEDEEETEHLRQRYFASLDTQAFGGNRQDYTGKVDAIPGVGGSKVYRAWNSDIHPSALIPPEGTEEWLMGVSATEEIKAWLDTVFAAARDSKLTVGGTVKLVIIDSTYSVPSSALIELVQTEIDPVQNAGEGFGLAPIGHVVKVEGVASEGIDLAFSLQYQSGWTWPDVEAQVLQSLNDYFTELAKGWKDQEGPLVVRVSQIESRLLTLAGILDISGTEINGLAENHTLALDHIPLLGTVTPRSL